MVSGVISILIYGSAAWLTEMQRASRKTEIVAMVSTQRNEILATISRNRTKILADAANFSSDPSGSPGGVYSGLLRVVSASGAVVVNSTNPASGFDLLGKPCASFNESMGDDSCPFRWEVTWDSDACDPLTKLCSPDEIFIRGSLKYRPKKNVIYGGFFESAYSFQDISEVQLANVNPQRGSAPPSPAETCQSLGGIWNGAKCVLDNGGSAGGDLESNRAVVVFF